MLLADPKRNPLKRILAKITKKVSLTPYLSKHIKVIMFAKPSLAPGTGIGIGISTST